MYDLRLNIKFKYYILVYKIQLYVFNKKFNRLVLKYLIFCLYIFNIYIYYMFSL